MLQLSLAIVLQRHQVVATDHLYFEMKKTHEGSVFAPFLGGCGNQRARGIIPYFIRSIRLQNPIGRRFIVSSADPSARRNQDQRQNEYEDQPTDPARWGIEAHQTHFS